MKEFFIRFYRNRSAMFGFIILNFVILFALFGPLFNSHGPFEMVAPPQDPPFGKYFFGTDMLGRDIGVALAYGARTSLFIGIVATGVAVFTGTLIGAVAGYFGGWIDNVLMRLTELFQTIPNFIFAIVLLNVINPSIWAVTFVIGMVTWPGVARLVRGEFIGLRSREFVEACFTQGMSDLRIMVFHILPNCLSSLIVVGSLMVASAILFESALSFLGLGDPNVMSWGFLIGGGRSSLRAAWWICAFPGVAIFITVLSINLVGEGINDAINPRLRNM